MNISSLLEFVIRIESAYEKFCKPAYEEFNLSKTSFDILMFLANNPKYSTAKDISQMKNIKPNVVSSHVDQLVNDGYLERQGVEGDRRMYKLVLLPKSNEIISLGHKYQCDFYKTIIQGLSEEDLNLYHRCFKIIYDNAVNIK